MIVLLDADGVLFDFLSPALRALADCGGPQLKHDECDRYAIESYLETQAQRDAWWRRVTEPGFCFLLQPYEGAVDIVRDLRVAGHTVLCVTSPMDSRTWAGERAEALKLHFGFARDHIISTPGKHWVPGHFLADDNEGHCEKWSRAHPDGRSIVIKRPYNNGDHTLESFARYVEGWS